MSIDLGLSEVRGFLFGMHERADAVRRPVLRGMITHIDRALSTRIKSSSRHDAGAIARCSWCGRYSTNVLALVAGQQPFCGCGRVDGWCGSFKRPTATAEWSLR